MKSFSVVVTGLLIVFFSCKKEAAENGCTPERTSTTFQTNKQLDTITHRHFNGDSTSFYKINPGNKLVFKYEHSSGFCPNVIDGGGSLHVVFQVPEGVTFFVADDSTELRQLKVGTQFNSWFSSGFRFITSGLLEGQKKNENTWRIIASFPSTNNNGLFFETDFIKE
jgi:hypothetical protein